MFDIVIPIHNAADELAICLQSVAATVPSDTVVWLIDDASTQAQVRRVIQSALSLPGPEWRARFQLHNQGFVKTANLGMVLSQRDVLLLNSDTQVTDGWYERICECAQSNSDIGTVTPWSNNAEIASLPGFCQANPIPAEPDKIARTIATTGKPAFPELPTAVGFCMYIKRALIERIGLFDAVGFGLGYGEENDYSRRAVRAGFRNVLCDNAYVVHAGGCSFAAKGLRPDSAALQRVIDRHSDYLDVVQEFIRSDPLALRRGQLVAALTEQNYL